MEEQNRFKLEISEEMLELREFRDEMREDNRYEAEEIPKSQAEINEELYGFKSVFKEEFAQFRAQNDEQMADILSKLHAIMDLLHEIMKSRGLEPPDLVGAPLNQLNSNPIGSTLVLAADQLQADDNEELGLDTTAAGNPVHDKMLKNTKLIDSEEIKGNDSTIKFVEDGNNFNEMLMSKSVGKDEGIGLNEGNVVDGGVVLSLIDLQQALGSLGDTTVNNSSNGSTKAWFGGATSTIEVVLGQNAIDDTAHYLFDELPRPFLVEQSDRNAGNVGKEADVLSFVDLQSALSSEYEATMNGSINGSTKAWFEEEKSIMEVVLRENAIEDDAYKVFDEMIQTIRAVLLNEQVTDLYTNDVNFNKLVLFDPGGGGDFVTCLNKGAFRPFICKDQRTCVNGMERVVSSVLFALSIMPSRDTHCLVGSNYFYLFSCGTHAIIALIVDNIVHGDDFTEMDLTALFEEVNSQLLMKVLSFDPGGFSLPKVGSDPLEFKGDKGKFRLTTIVADILVKAITHKCRILKVSVCGVVVLYPQKLDGEVVYYIEYIRDHIVNYLCVYKAFKLLGFEVLCKKGVTAGSMREFIAAFFGSIPKKCGNEELCDEATDKTSDNAVKLFVFIYDWVLFVYCDWIMFAWLLLIDKSASDKPGVDILTDFPQHGSDQFMSKTKGMVVQLTMVCCVIYSSSICSCMSEFVKLLCTRELPIRGRGHDCIQHLIAQNAGSIDMVGRFFLSSFDYPLANQPSWIESKGFDLQDTVDINDALSDVLVIVQTNGFFMFVWDPGRYMTPYILEDKDVFERVGKWIIPIDITLMKMEVIKDVQNNCIIMGWCEIARYLRLSCDNANDGYLLQTKQYGEGLVEVFLGTTQKVHFIWGQHRGFMEEDCVDVFVVGCRSDHVVMQMILMLWLVWYNGPSYDHASYTILALDNACHINAYLAGDLAYTSVLQVHLYKTCMFPKLAYFIANQAILGDFDCSTGTASLKNFVWDPDICHFTTLRTRRLLRGRICHVPRFKIRKTTREDVGAC